MLLNGYVMVKERKKFYFFLSEEGEESVHKDPSVKEDSVIKLLK